MSRCRCLWLLRRSLRNLPPASHFVARTLTRFGSVVRGSSATALTVLLLLLLGVVQHPLHIRFAFFACTGECGFFTRYLCRVCVALRFLEKVVVAGTAQRDLVTICFPHTPIRPTLAPVSRMRLLVPTNAIFDPTLCAGPGIKLHTIPAGSVAHDCRRPLMGLAVVQIASGRCSQNFQFIVVAFERLSKRFRQVCHCLAKRQQTLCPGATVARATA